MKTPANIAIELTDERLDLGTSITRLRGHVINLIVAAIEQDRAQATEVAALGLGVSIWASDHDGVDVVQIDTGERSGRFRVNVNDAPVWDGDPELDNAGAPALAAVGDIREQVEAVLEMAKAARENLAPVVNAATSSMRCQSCGGGFSSLHIVENYELCSGCRKNHVDAEERFVLLEAALDAHRDWVNALEFDPNGAEAAMGALLRALYPLAGVCLNTKGELEDAR